MGQITYPNKSTGGKFYATEANEIKNVVNENFNLKQISSIESLRSKSAELNDEINLLGYYADSTLGGGPFKCIKTEYDKKIILLEANSNKINGSGLSYSFNGNSDKISLSFKLNAITGSSYVSTFQSLLRFQAKPSNGDGDFTLVNAGYGEINNTVDENNDIVEELFLGKWYTVTGTPSEGVLTSFVVGGSFSNVNDIDIKEFVISNETFECQEGSGTTTTGSLGTVATLVGSPLPTWGNIDYDNGFNFIQSGSFVFEKQIQNNTVMPYDFGAKSSSDLTDYSFDNTNAINAAFNSKYNVVVPAGFFYHSGEIYAKEGKEISGHGAITKISQSTAAGRDYTLNEILPNAMTVFYTDQNIDCVTIQSQAVSIRNILLYTNGVPLHTKSGWRWDIDYKIWGSQVIDCGVFGNIDTLQTTGAGTIGFNFDTQTTTRYGFFEQIHVIRGYAENCAVGTRHLDVGRDVSETTNWSNTNSAEVYGTACKTFFDVQGGAFEIKGLCQAKPVKNLEEKDLPAINHNCSNGHMNCFVMDADAGDGVDGKYAFTGQYIKFNPSKNSTWGPASIIHFINRKVDYGNFSISKNPYVPNDVLIAQDDFYISRFDNVFAFAQDFGHVVYKGFKADNLAWFNTNLLPADNVGNPNPLVESANITITNADRLLKSGDNYNALVSQQVTVETDKDLYFGEVVIYDINTLQDINSFERLMGLFISTSNSYFNKLQIIIGFSNDTSSKIIDVISKDGIKGKFTFLADEDFASNTNLRSVIIRFIGSTDITQSTGITDIFGKLQYDRNLPYIKSVGAQNFWGDFKFPTDTNGIVLTDRTTTTQYRLLVDNGVLSIEAI